MKSFIAIAALASVATAWEYPDCERDNCYRNLIDERFTKEAPEFCFKFLAGTTTAPSAIPTQFNNCNIKEASSACSCITYTATHTSKPTSSAPGSTSKPTSSVPTSSSPASSSPASSKPVSSQSSSIVTSSKPQSTQWTTSTICETRTITVTKCPDTVPNCPTKHTTVITQTIPITTTVCPVTTAPPAGNGTTTWAPTQVPSSKPPTVTAAAGRFVVEYAAAAVGLVAALL